MNPVLRFAAATMIFLGTYVLRGIAAEIRGQAARIGPLRPRRVAVPDPSHRTHA